MDSLGLAIGVAGLGSLFASCVQSCEIIDSGKEYGIESEILATRVGLEKVRLSLWGESVGLAGYGSNGPRPGTPQPIDRRLGDQRICNAVYDILSCVKNLFEDTNSLRRRYGLQHSPITETQTRLDSSQSAVQSTFKCTYENFQLVIPHTQHSPPLKATPRWIITDMRRSQHFIDNLRGFNDSLVAFFPDIEISTRAEMTADIRSSLNADHLFIIGEAVADWYWELFYATSMRLREISQTQGQKQPHQQGEPKDNSQASNVVPPANLEYLTKKIDNLDIKADAKNKGALEISIHNSWAAKYSCSVGWNSVDGSDYFVQKAKEGDFVKHPYLSWLLQHATERKKHQQAYFGYQNAEARAEYEGKFPGTVTAYGYAGEFGEWAEINKPKDPDSVFSATNRLPPHTLGELANRLRVLQTRKELPWGQEAISKDLRELIGTAGLSYTDPSDEHDMTSQVLRILEQLNRQDIFDDLRYGGSIAALALAPPEAGFMGMRNFLLQIILGYELLLRLEKSNLGFSGLTNRVAATIQITERWMEGVLCEQPEGKPNSIDFHSLVHERQIEGLIRFAEAIGWPHVSEMREYAKGIYSSARAGGDVEPALWDWIFGVVFPGDNFIFKIMSTLVTTTPSLHSIGESPFFSASLVLPDRSYWRARYVVGRVLAGVKGVKSACGWVGPCPPVADSSINGWVRIRSRKPAFILPSQTLRYDSIGETIGNSSSTSDHDAPADPQGEWIKDTSDPSKWVIPNGPSLQTAESAAGSPKYNFHALYLSAVIPRPSGSPSETCPEYSATIEIAVSITNSGSNKPDESPIAFSLFSQPTFIATHRCIDGPHSVHKHDLPRLQNICSVRDLIARRYGPRQQQQEQRRDVLIIDATCEGGELVARAWCAEIGQHAVVRRGDGTCFACAVRMASGQGLGVGCLIWS